MVKFMIVCTVCTLYENNNKTKIQKELHMPPTVKEDNPAVKIKPENENVFWSFVRKIA
jgi:hypothetical protein